MDIFLERVTPLQEEPQAGPSVRIPGEGIVIRGDDSSMLVIAPEDPPWDKKWNWKRVMLMILTLCRLRLMCLFVF